MTIRVISDLFGCVGFASIVFYIKALGDSLNMVLLSLYTPSIVHHPFWRARIVNTRDLS